MLDFRGVNDSLSNKHIQPPQIHTGLIVRKGTLEVLANSKMLRPQSNRPEMTLNIYS